MTFDRILHYIKLEYTRVITDNFFDNSTSIEQINQTIKKNISKILKRSQSKILLPLITADECEKAELFKEKDYYYLPLYIEDFLVTQVILPSKENPDELVKYTLPSDCFKNITDIKTGVRAILFKPAEPITETIKKE